MFFFLSRFASSVLRHEAYYAICSCSFIIFHNLVYYRRWAYKRHTFQYVLLSRMLHMLYLTFIKVSGQLYSHIYATSAYIRSSLLLLPVSNNIMLKNLKLIYVPFHNNGNLMKKKDR
jgi:hypothetical protein